MSSGSVSRGSPISEFSLADVLAAIQSANLPDRRRQDMASALRTVARVLGRPLTSVPADPRRLSIKLKETAPGAIGISRGRWNNIRAHVRASLALVQPMTPGRRSNGLSRAWGALWRQLDSRPAKVGVSRFLRFCSAEGIEPKAVTEATFTLFRGNLDNTLLKNPDKAFAGLARSWRMAQGAVEGWPAIDVAVPDRRNRWTLALTSFPASFQQDCNDWFDRLSGRDLVEGAVSRPVRPITVAHRNFEIRSFASALVLRGRDPGTITSLRDLVEIEAFKQGLMLLIERRGGKSTSAICHLAQSLKSIARHHLHLDKDHLDRLGSIIRRLETGQHGLTETNRKRLRQLDDSQNLRALLQLPRKLMGIAARNPRRHRGAVEAQIAVAVEILLMAPMRISNLTRLDLDQNLIRPGPSGAIHIVVEPEGVKNSQPLDYPLPPPSVELIERYIQEFRPRLAPASSTALFPAEAEVQRYREVSRSKFPIRAMPIPECGSTFIYSATLRLSSISTPIQEGTRLYGACSDSAPSIRRSISIPVLRRRRRSVISTGQFSNCEEIPTPNDQHPSSRSGSSVQKARGLA